MNEACEPLWSKLAALPRPRLDALFAADKGRVARLSSRLDLPGGGGVLFDWSKTHLDEAHLALFEELAQAAGFAEARRRLFAETAVL